jgi:Type III restriction enzyme, res subunit
MYSIDSKRIISDASHFDTFQNLLPYKFKKQGRTYRAGRKGGVYLKENRNGVLTAYFPNGDYTGGDILTIAAQVSNIDLKTGEGFKTACMELCKAANLDFSKYCTDAPSDYQFNPTPSVLKPIETKVFLPNAGQPLNKSFDYELASPESFTYKAAVKFYERKTGAKQVDLKGLGVYPLQSITYIETGLKTVFNHKKIGIGYFPSGLSETIKVKIIDLESKGKKQMFTVQNTGNYVYGLKNIPTESRKDFTLLLCGGEDDTNAVNTNLQPFNYCALTFGSESASIPSDFLTYLQSEFKAVFCLLDNDKTGVKMAIRNATSNGLPYISIGDYYPSIKDICDLYKQFGTIELLKLVKVEIKTKTAQKTNFERIGYNLHKVLNLDIDQYLSEKLPYLQSYISTNQKLLLQSPTDTGKTTAIVEMSKDTDFYKNIGIESIILAVPRLFLAHQLKEVFEQKTGVTPSIIDGKASLIDIQEAYQSRVIICTYDSLKKLQSHLKYSLLVIDEMHLLTDDTGFRSEVTAKVFELIPQAKRVLGLTATPNYEMCIGMQLDEKYVPNDIRNALDFTLCKVSLKKDQAKKLQLNCYAESRISAVTAYAKNIAQGSEKAAVLLNDVKVLETVSEVINLKYSEATTTILSSKKPAYNVENPTYNAIVKGEAVPTETRLFLGTNILTAGISLNFAVENLAVFGNLDSRTITQFSARPRLKGEVNKALQVDLFKTMTATEFETVLSDFEQKNIETGASLNDKKNCLEWLQSDIQTAVTLCEAANKLDKSDKVRRKAFDELGFIYFDESTNEFKPNLPSIIYNHNGRIERRLTLYGKLLKAKQYDNTFEVLTPQYVNFEDNQQATDILSDKKEAAKEVKATAFEVFAENKNTCLELAFKQSSDYELKENIKGEISVFKDLSDKAKELKTRYPSVIDTLPSIAGRYFDLKGASFGVAEITPKKTLKMLTNVQKESEYQLLKNRIISLSELRSLENESLTNAEKLRALNSKRIIEKVRDFKKAKRRDWVTGGELLRLVTDKRRIDLKEAKTRVSELFEVSTERKELTNGKQTVYKIGHRLTLESVIEKALNRGETADKTPVENAANLGQNRGEICRIENTHKALINN